MPFSIKEDTLTGHYAREGPIMEYAIMFMDRYGGSKSVITTRTEHL